MEVVEGGYLKAVTCLRILLFLSNRSVAHCYGWRARGSENWSFLVGVINVLPIYSQPVKNK